MEFSLEMVIITPKVSSTSRSNITADLVGLLRKTNNYHITSGSRQKTHHLTAKSRL